MNLRIKDIFLRILGVFEVLLGFMPIILIIYYDYRLIFIYPIIGIIIMLIIQKKEKLKLKFYSEFLPFTIIWPWGLISYKDIFKQKSIFDEIMDIPEIKEYNELLDKLNINGTDKDEIPGGKGRFGLDVTNPIPTRGIYGSNNYLKKLIDIDGNSVSSSRLSSTFSPNIKNPIDIYEIRDKDNIVKAKLFISPYHKKTSSKAPEGFMLGKDIFEYFEEQIKK